MGSKAPYFKARVGEPWKEESIIRAIVVLSGNEAGHGGSKGSATSQQKCKQVFRE